MGQMQNLQAEQDGLRQLASDLLLQTDHLEECPHGERLAEGDDDLTDTYQAANAQITSGQIKLPRGVSRRNFTDLIKDVYEDTGVECPSCAKMRNDD